MCKSKGKEFGEALLDYGSIDQNVLFCYLNIAMTSTATVKFKERMAYEKFSDAVTIFEEAFAVLVLENNFDRWIYLAEKTVKKHNETVDNDTESSDDDAPPVLYQQKIKTRKDKRETAGKWTDKGMVRLNSLITMVKAGRNSETREDFEEELQDVYVKNADSNMELMAKNKRKREMEELNSRKKGVVVENVLDFVAL